MEPSSTNVGGDTPAHIRTGRDGERIAREYLQRQDFLIVACNERIPPHDEIDIVAYDPTDKVIVFVEVKTRSRNSRDFRPELDLTPSKRRSMARAARGWVDARAWPGGYRLDVVAVVEGEVVAHYKEVEWMD